MLNNLLKIIPRMWKAQDLNPGNVASEFVLLTATLCFIFARVSLEEMKPQDSVQRDHQHLVLNKY